MSMKLPESVPIPKAGLLEVLGKGFGGGFQQGMQQQMQLLSQLQLEKQKQRLKQEGLQNILGSLGLGGQQQPLQEQGQMETTQAQQVQNVNPEQMQLERIATNPTAMATLASINPQMATQIQQMYGNVLKQRKEAKTVEMAEKKMALQDTKKFRDDIRKSADSADRLLKSVKNQQMLIDKGLKTGPLTWDRLMFKIGMKGAASPEAQAFQANLLNFMEGQREKFGVRLTDADLKLIQDKLPDIARSKDGNRLILSLFESEAEYEKVKKQALSDAMKQGMTLDLEERYQEILDKKILENPNIKNNFANTLNALYTKAGGKQQQEKIMEEGFIKMIDPAGNLRKVSKEQSQEAQNAGYKLMQ